MPRKTRIDAPGALHHITVKGIERRKIFRDESDRTDFLERLGNIVSDTLTQCVARTLIPNQIYEIYGIYGTSMILCFSMRKRYVSQVSCQEKLG
jgi:REP element-mobilizing transposase RayT